MKRFVIAAALAVAIGLGYSNTAGAQIVYGYAAPSGAGVATGRTVIVPGAVQMQNNYYSPLTGAMMGQTYTQNFLGQANTMSYGYNPLTGMGYRTGFYQPNVYFNPYGGVNYGVVRRWW
jgi:hypothetical protein